MKDKEILAKIDELERFGLEEALKSNLWAERYNKAPERAKRWFRHAFAFSVFAMGSGGSDKAIDQFCDAVKERRDKLYRDLDDESWRYLFDVMPGVVKLGLGQTYKELKGKPFSSRS